MSIFKMALEGADEQKVVTGEVTPEEETATAAVTDTEVAASEVASESADLDELGDAQEQLEDIGEAVAQESHGLTPGAAKYLQLSLKRIVGAKHTNKMVRMESYNDSRYPERENKRIVLEGIADTLKQLWQAIKAQLKKFYAKVKTWFVKMFSSAKKLADRAKKLRNKSDSTVGTIEDKTFSFSQTPAINMEGKYNDPSKLLAGLNTLTKTVDGLISVKKAEAYEKNVDDLCKTIEDEVKRIIRQHKSNNFDKDTFGVADSVITNKLNDINSSFAGSDAAVSDDKLKKMFTTEGELKTVNIIPGGKAVYKVIDKTGATKGHSNATISNITTRFKNTGYRLGNDRYNPRDVSEGDVKTLTTSQVSKVCDDVIDIAELAFDYEKAWERRDKFQSKLEKDIDNLVKDNASSDDEVDDKVARAVRNYAESATTQVRRRTSFDSSFLSHALKTANAFLNYGERSLAQHK